MRRQILSAAESVVRGALAGFRRLGDDLAGRLQVMMSLMPSGSSLGRRALVAVVEGLEDRRLLTYNPAEGTIAHLEGSLCNPQYASSFMMSDPGEEPQACSCPISEVGPGDTSDESQPAANTSAFGGKGVRLSDGSPSVAASDLLSPGFGTPWGHTRSYGNTVGYNTGTDTFSPRPNGNRWAVQELPYVVDDGNASSDALIVVDGGTRQRWFDDTDAGAGYTFVPRLYSKIP